MQQARTQQRAPGYLHAERLRAFFQCACSSKLF
jgi:hypothetical protein